MIRPTSYSAQRRQRGVALISVLLVFAIITVIASEIVSGQYFSLRKTGHLVTHSQAREYALGGESYARQLLYQDFEEGQTTENASDSLDEAWAKPDQEFDFSDGKLTISIIDLQSKFNVNNVILAESVTVPGNGIEPAAEDNVALGGRNVPAPENEGGSESDANGGNNGSKGQTPKKQALAQFSRLLTELGGDESMAATLADWLDEDETPQGLDTEDTGYLGAEPAYRTANGIMATTTELRLLQGAKQRWTECMAAYAVALPEATAINVNTAPAQVLTSLSPGISLSDAEAIVSEREGTPFTELDTFLQLPQLSGIELSGAQVAVHSRYFEIQVQAEFAERVVYLRSVLHRDPESGTMRVLARRFGAVFEQLASDESPEDEDFEPADRC